MRAATSLAAFGAGLAVVFAGAVGVGNAVGPVGTIDEAPTAGHSDAGHSDAGHSGAGHSGGAPAAPQGLSSSLEGYTLELDQTELPAGRPAGLSFRVLGPDGQPVTRFTPTHERDLHLVVVRRDGSGFQHVHPERDADGRWSTELVLPDAGAWKVFADSAPGSRTDPLVLAADLSVAGDYAPAGPPVETRTDEVDGFTVRVDGDLVAGTASELVLTVERDGVPVTDLQPYLGAYGHLVSLRSGDLAYVHTHPEGEPGDGRTEPGPDLDFVAEVPTEGDYRLYLDFQHDGVVRTAELVLSTTSTAGAAGASDDHDEPHGH